MSRIFSPAGVEFLQHYPMDVCARWSPEDLAAQQEFVNAQIAGRSWLDWSSPAETLQLVQASHADTSFAAGEEYEALVLAGPVVVLLEPARFFHQDASALRPDGKLVGIIPCLPDHSPEAQQSIHPVAPPLWQCWTAE